MKSAFRIYDHSTYDVVQATIASILDLDAYACGPEHFQFLAQDALLLSRSMIVVCI